MAAYVVVAHWHARPGEADRLAEVLAQMVAPSRAEPGCLAYEVHRSTEDPGHHMLYEQYTDEDAYAAHQASDHFRDVAVAQGFPLLASRERTTFTLLQATTNEAP